ncbi:Uncharacterized conserved protein [Allopseudospirillum japonicum]|uniref:Uncharacterized conserved protein n=1 Tax=Allopseudospirillum japonicum TaxID=64971 RepID=A0A1H6QS05_9GAMM|nr:DUF411 domain-containing protein [Allopseudospirillum japonicum]SEI42035.1 Uncharacterized conserved protein [Allopseudospirillum japonicum]
MSVKAYLLPLLAVFTPSLSLAADGIVYKHPQCGCCEDWIEHMRTAGFELDVQNLTEMSAKKQALGIPDQLASCHTAQIGDYLIEGHVPAQDVRTLLAQQPKIAGLSVPGMPHGSPGMETGRFDPYTIVGFNHQGQVRLWRQVSHAE